MSTKLSFAEAATRTSRYIVIPSAAIAATAASQAEAAQYVDIFMYGYTGEDSIGNVPEGSPVTAEFYGINVSNAPNNIIDTGLGDYVEYQYLDAAEGGGIIYVGEYDEFSGFHQYELNVASPEYGIIDQARELPFSGGTFNLYDEATISAGGFTDGEFGGGLEGEFGFTAFNGQSNTQLPGNMDPTFVTPNLGLENIAQIDTNLPNFLPNAQASIVIGGFENPEADLSAFFEQIDVYAYNDLQGDYNGDGIVDMEDHDVFVQQYGKTTVPGLGADGNEDGVVNAADYTVYRDNFGESLSATSTSTAPPAQYGTISNGSSSGTNTIPEPSTAFLAASLAVARLMGRSRSRPTPPKTQAQPVDPSTLSFTLGD